MYLTQTQRASLAEELERLLNRERPLAAEQVVAAREQSTNQTENAPYEAALGELNRIEERIIWLQSALLNAEDADAPDGSTVQPGCLVTVQFAPRDKQTFLYGSTVGDAGEVDVISVDSPLGKALDGAKAGDKVTYRTPAGGQIKVTVKTVTAS